MTHIGQIPSASQAQSILQAWETGGLRSFTEELENTLSSSCEPADEAERERWELLTEVALELLTAARLKRVETTDVCWSLLRHLAGISKAASSKRKSANSRSSITVRVSLSTRA